jgi:hypothetical protein
LNIEQSKVAEVLRDSIPPDPELPAAEPDAPMRPALFDSEVDFVTATRRLIARKKLAE